MNARLFAVLAAALALLAAGLATGTRVYYVLLIALVLVLLYALCSLVIAIFSVRVGMKGLRSRAVRGDSLMIFISVKHFSPLPLGSMRIVLEVPGGKGQQELRVNAPPFVQRSFRSVIRCAHRGCYEVGIRSISVQDIFGLFSFTRRHRRKLMRLEVAPRLVESALMQLHASDMGPEFRAQASEDNASPSDIRPWREGDALKKVHWKLSYRKRELMVRTFEESARPDTLILPDLSELTALSDQRLTLEDAICELALGAAKAQLEGGFPVRMPLQSAKPQELAGRTAGEIASFVDALMRVRFDSPYPYEQVLMPMFRRMQRTGGAILITSRMSTRCADIAMRMQKSGILVKFIWVTDAPRNEALEMLERMKMAGVTVEQYDPWIQDQTELSGSRASS